jgi:hypothetical protein
MGAVGGITGMLAGSLAPGILTGLYAFDGPEPPPTFSPVIWGSQQGFLIGLLFGAGVAMLALSCLYLASWRPQMTTRRWMVAVAVVAVAITGVRIGDRWLSYRRIAAHHSQMAETGMKMIDGLPSAAEVLTPQNIDYHAEMARKYQYAARYPWLPVEPDPPEPE